MDPNTDEIIGEGWNRMPAGCEDRFGWGKGEQILKTKYPYGEKIMKWLAGTSALTILIGILSNLFTSYALINSCSCN